MNCTNWIDGESRRIEETAWSMFRDWKAPMGKPTAFVDWRRRSAVGKVCGACFTMTYISVNLDIYNEIR